ncbi:hypothetical protein [Luteococcus sp. OSA5]|uniref:hypothetical protein n=1 Tax=Luteococcus sp. OSA5 TaxID=3401630 RepID=UPI003B429C34
MAQTSAAPTTGPSTPATPSTPEAPSTAAAPQTSASPAATTAGDLDQSVFAARLGRWKAVPGEGDEGTYQPNGSWVHALDPTQAVQGLSMQACRPGTTLPQPRHVLASDYRDDSQRRAVGQALRFANAEQAQAFAKAYRQLLQGCVGQQDPMSVTLIQQGNPLVDRRTMAANQTRWVEVVRTDGALVKLVAADEGEEPLTPAEVSALAAAV